MAQQFDSPKTETQLRELQDKLYQHSKEVYDARYAGNISTNQEKPRNVRWAYLLFETASYRSV